MNNPFVKIFVAIVFGVSFLVLGITIGGIISNPPHNRNVCNATKEQPLLVAAVDPKTGTLFAVPTLQTVCTDDK